MNATMRTVSLRLGFGLAVLLLGCASAPGAGEPSADAPHWPARGTKPLFVWDTALAENRVTVEGRSRPRSCRMVSLTGRVRHARFGQMDVVDGAFYGDFASGRRVRAAIAGSGRFAIELTLDPRLAAGDEREPGGYVLALDGEETPLAFALAQRGNDIVLLLNTPGDEEPAAVKVATVPVGRARHLVVNVTPQRITSHLDGKPAHDAQPPALDPAAWEAATLVFGSDWHGKHQWAGTLEGVALYPEPLDAAAIAAHARRAAERLAERPEPSPLTVKATLRGTSQPPDASVYPRALVLYHYEVNEVVDGELDADALLVYHWGVLGGRRQPVLERQIGKAYELLVEPYDRFAAVLEEEQRSEEAFVPGPPSYYDVSR